MPTRRLLLAATLCGALAAHAGELPYNENVDAKAELQQARQAAQASGRKLLVIFGANWCEDCRALDQAIKAPKTHELLGKEFVVLKVDVGRFDRNLPLVQQYGNPIRKGIPAAVVLSPDDRLLYATKAGELSNARRMSESGVYDFFHQVLQSTRVGG